MEKQSKILIVDDNPTNVMIMEEILEEYKTISASSGEFALKCAKDHRPDLILLDIMMPGMDGYQVCKSIREDPILRLGKIIMVSAKAMTEERLEGYKAGADDYITKPFDSSELLAKVKVYLRLKSEEEVNQLKSDFLRLLQLETNNPLNSIIGPVDILKDNLEMDSEQRISWLEMIKRGALQLQSLFEKVVFLSSIRSGSIHSEKEFFDLGTLIRESVVKLSEAASDKDLTIEQHLSDTGYILLDRLQMTRVVMTLLKNAIRFSSSKEKVTLNLREEGEYFLFQVSDNGIGISAEALPNLFDEFAKMDLKYHSQHHGLNLAIAYHIIQEHKGSIEVESIEGSGTTFSIWLPKTMEEDSYPQ